MAHRLSLLVSLIAACGSEKGDVSPPPTLDASTESTETLPDDGCITLNGKGGFATISQALSWAEDGDVISLCSETYSERVIIDKAITLKGPTSGAPAIIDNPEDTSAISIRADNVTVSWVTVSGPSVGVLVDAVDNINLRVISFGEVGDTPVRVKGGTNVLLQSANFSERDGTAIYIDDGGSMRVVSCLFDRLRGYATVADSGATLSLEGNEFFDGQADEEGIVGDARAKDGASLYTSGNLFSDSLGAAIRGTDATIQSVSDTFQGGTYAIHMTGGHLTVDGSSIANPTVTGIRAYDLDGPASLSNTEISATPSTHVLEDATAWALSRADQGVGIYLTAASEVSLTNLTVTGFNHGGVYLGSASSEPLSATLTSLTIDGVGWHGLYVRDADATVTDTTISEIRVHESTLDSLCTTVGDYGGATFRTSTADWTGGGVYDSAGIGIGALESDLVFNGINVHDNGCAGIMNFQGTLLVDDSDFSAPSINALGASVVSYLSPSSTVTNSRFTDSYEVAESFTSGSSSFLYVYYDRVGADIQAWYEGDHVVSDNTFTSGSRGVYANGANLTVQGNTWTDYAQYGALVVDGTLDMTDNVFSMSSGHAAACIQGVMSLENQVVDTTLTSEDRSYEVWSDGVVIVPSSPANANYAALFSEGCDTTITSSSFSDTSAMALSALGGTHTFSDVEVLRANSSGFITSAALEFGDGWVRDGLSYTSDVNLNFSNVTITETGDWGGAITFVSSTLGVDEATSTLSLSDTTISEVGGDAIATSGANLILTDVAISTTSGSGISMESGDLSGTNVTIDGAGGVGIQASGGSVELDGITSQFGGYHGLWLTSAELSMTSSTIKNNAQNGIQLTDTTATLIDNNITSNGGFGLGCATATILACDNLFGDNTLGPTDACDAACFETDGPAPDSGIPDTGMTDTGDDAAEDTDTASPSDEAEVDTGTGGDLHDTGTDAPAVPELY